MMKLLAASLLLHPVHANHATCDGKKLFDAPSGDHGAWLAKLKSWRKERQKSYTGEVYEEPSLYWTRTSFLQPQIHVYDRYLYDGSWTVDRYLDDLQRRFGGIDSVLIWPTYTNIGIDERNQFDYYRVVPGGLPAVTSLTEAFHRRGVRVLWGYNPWDQATRQEGSHWEVLAELLKETGGDGFNGDTMPEIPRQFWSSALQRRYPIAAEPEDGGIPCGDNWTAASWTPLGWGYFSELAPDHMTRTYDFAPGGFACQPRKPVSGCLLVGMVRLIGMTMTSIRLSKTMTHMAVPQNGTDPFWVAVFREANRLWVKQMYQNGTLTHGTKD